MTADPQWIELQRLFDEGLEMSPDERARLVAQVRGQDAPLGNRLARMFEAHDRTGPLDRSVAPSPDDLPGRVTAALQDRYVLDETLGVGGMAAVFLAHERKHDRKVVIKVLQPRLAAAIGTTRFLDEVRIAARLSHPHILTLIDSGATEGLLYYVTPYVGGETLRDRLGREGALPLRNAVTLLRDIADALAHAHDAGIVHRDLKPENVLCVGDHAFLLDFGVAKLEAGVSATGATSPGLAIGTPGYMAPEQAAGEPVDHRADIYVWGLLARELFTGRRSLQGPLETSRPDVPRSLVALIDACVALDPFERPDSAAALAAALDDHLATPAKRSRWHRWPMVAASLLLLAAAFVAWRRTPVATPGPQLVGPIAVAPFDDETADSSLGGWGRLAGDWITQGLHEAGLLTVVPWQSSLIAAEHHHREESAGRAPGTLVVTMRRETGAGAVITGSYYRTGDSLRFQATVSDARNGSLLIAPAPVIVGLDSAGAAIRMLRERIMGAIALQLDDRITPGIPFATHPPTYDAYVQFDRGLGHFNRYEYADARRLMLESWNRDSTFMPALIFAAFAAVNDGEWSTADSLVQVALRHRSTLNAYYAALSDYLAAYLDGDRERALRELRQSTTIAPGTRASYNAAYVLQQLNRPAEAESVLAAMDPDHGPMRDWPAYWSQRAYANHLLGRHDTELSHARSMRSRHPGQRVTWVIEARALAAAGRHRELDSLLRTDDHLEPDVYWSYGAMLVIAAEELHVHGTGDAEPRYRQAVAWLEERLATQPGNRNHRDWLASALIGLGQHDSAERVLQGLWRERPERFGTRGQLALIAARRGDRAAADRLLADAPRHLRGEQSLFRARVAAILGDREGALNHLRAALRSGVDNWHWATHHAWPDFALLRDDQRFMALVDRRAP